MSKNTAARCLKELNYTKPQNNIHWPSQSPDVNPIENLFEWLKQELLKRRPFTLKALKDDVVAIWESIDVFFLEPYWSSMPKRCQLLVDNKGYKIKY